MLPRFLFLSVLLFAATTVRGREWTDNTGKFHVEGDLKAVEDGSVLLTKSDGSSLKVPLDRLSECDRQFATKFCSVASLEFGNGHSLECTILQTSPTDFTIMHGFMVLRMPRSGVTAVKDVDSKIAPTAERLASFGRLQDSHCVCRGTTLGIDFQQIPATVIDNGVLRNVPYKSFRAGQDYEINIYGDPVAACWFRDRRSRRPLERGERQAKLHCIHLQSTARPADREAVRGLSLEKGKNVHNGITFEVTPPSDPDAYGGWWVSAYNEVVLNSVRANDKEMESITVAKNSLKPKTSAVCITRIVG